MRQYKEKLLMRLEREGEESDRGGADRHLIHTE